MSDGRGQSGPANDLVLLPGNPPPENVEVIWYEGRVGRRLRMMLASEPAGAPKRRGTVLVCPGRTEFIEKYFEVARDLQARGFAVVIFDWPGQGLSARMHKNPLAGHVRSFGVYVDAFVGGLAQLGSKAPKPHVILAHSMGGAIALQALRTRRVQASAVCFSAPMWGLPVWFYQRWQARLTRLFGFGGLVVRPPPPEETFATNPVTHDERRWRIQHDLAAADPRLRLGEPTIAWVVASLNVMRSFFAPGALDDLSTMPTLVAIAAEDVIVKNAAIRKLARRFKAGKVVTVKGAAHEILMETDERRAELLAAFDAMMKHAKI